MRPLLKKALVALGGLFALMLIAVLVFGVHVARTWDRVYDLPLPAVTVSSDPNVIARGEYLVYGPGHCVECHASSFEDFLKVGSGERPPLRGGLELPMGPLGKIYSANLTPDPETGIGRYSDGQLARTMRSAVRPDGRSTIDPMMPFGHMSDEDLSAIISYLRAQPPVRSPVPDNEWTLMGKVVRTLAPTFKPRTNIHVPAATPVEAPTSERGEYLARYVANCVGCHTQRNAMTYEAIGPDFAGGMEIEPLPLPGADMGLWFTSPNLTPAAGSALSKYPTREAFIARFRAGARLYAGSAMPWEAFATMSDADLGALYEFFRSLPPAPNPAGELVFRKQ